jgi:hypothetical protein
MIHFQTYIFIWIFYFWMLCRIRVPWNEHYCYVQFCLELIVLFPVNDNFSKTFSYFFSLWELTSTRPPGDIPPSSSQSLNDSSELMLCRRPPSGPTFPPAAVPAADPKGHACLAWSSLTASMSKFVEPSVWPSDVRLLPPMWSQRRLSPDVFGGFTELAKSVWRCKRRLEMSATPTAALFVFRSSICSECLRTLVGGTEVDPALKEKCLNGFFVAGGGGGALRMTSSMLCWKQFIMFAC